MKRLLLILLTVLTVLSLCSCAEEKDPYDVAGEVLKGAETVVTDTGLSVSVKGGEDSVLMTAMAVADSSYQYAYVLDATLEKSTCSFVFYVMEVSTGATKEVAAGSVAAAEYDCNTMAQLSRVDSSYNGVVLSVRNTVSSVLYESIVTLDGMLEGSDVSLADLGYTSFAPETEDGSDKAVFEDYRNKSFGERLKYAGLVTLIGLGMVFLVLTLLLGVVSLMHRICNPKSEPKTAPASAPVAEPVPASVADTSDDGEIAAAISAAVAAYLAAENGGEYHGGFRVVSFKRAGNGSAWNK